MKNFYQIKIQVKRIRPSIYRTIIVPENITFLKLHDYIQQLFELSDYHLWQFEKGNRFDSTLVSFDVDADMMGFHNHILNPEKTKINLLLLQQKDKLEYWYDFGDDWLMNVELQKIIPQNALPQKVNKIPFILRAKGPMLLEDIGGTYMFGDNIVLYEILKNNEKLSSKDEHEWQEFAFNVLGDEAEDDDWKNLYVELFDNLFKTDWNNFELE